MASVFASQNREKFSTCELVVNISICMHHGLIIFKILISGYTTDKKYISTFVPTIIINRAEKIGHIFKKIYKVKCLICIFRLLVKFAANFIFL